MKETESYPAHHHAPDDVGRPWIGGKRRQQHHADTQERQAEAADYRQVLENLAALGRMVLWQGAQDIRFELTGD